MNIHVSHVGVIDIMLIRVLYINHLVLKARLIFVPNKRTNKIFAPPLLPLLLPKIQQTASVTTTIKESDVQKQIAHSNTCAGNANKNILVKTVPSQTNNKNDQTIVNRNVQDYLINTDANKQLKTTNAFKLANVNLDRDETITLENYDNVNNPTAIDDFPDNREYD